ncbi:MAG: hypothetical protein JW739_07260 [Opitutales bacterium]|nr:hypothetical protein [Opitutales bacterium]
MTCIRMYEGISTSLTSTVNYLQLLETYQEDVQLRLHTERRVNQPTDNINAYMKSEAFNSYNQEIEGAQEQLALGIQLVSSTQTAIDSIEGTLETMMSLTELALEEDDASTREALGTKFNDLAEQLYSMAKDANYGDSNLLHDESSSGTQEDLTLYLFDEQSISLPAINFNGPPDNEEQVTLTMGDVNDPTTYSFSLAGDGANAVDWGSDEYKEVLGSLMTDLEEMKSGISIYENQLGNSGVFLELRESYNEKLANNYESVSDGLTLADLNEEAASSLAIQTAQSISLQTISLLSSTSDMRLQMLM